MLTKTMLEKARRRADAGIPPEELVDATTVAIDRALPPEERVRDYVRQIGNPYAFRVGKVAVRVRFAGKCTLEECLARHLSSPTGDARWDAPRPGGGPDALKCGLTGQKGHGESVPKADPGSAPAQARPRGRR